MTSCIDKNRTLSQKKETQRKSILVVICIHHETNRKISRLDRIDKTDENNKQDREETNKGKQPVVIFILLNI